MTLNFRFAIISDPHITLPHTLWQHPDRIHLGEVSIPVFETILERLSLLDLDFLLLPGDLTQHGEPDNHSWLADRLAQLPYPAYVIPGNHDIPYENGSDTAIAPAEFPHYYRKFGYDNPAQPYYTCQILPGVRLIGLNSNQFNFAGKQIGRLDDAQMDWLGGVLALHLEEFMMVMVHHNVVEHLPGQSRHSMGQRYMLENAPELLTVLRQAGVQLVFSGHLHVQDIACSQGVFDITTGSLVTYPHPFRVLRLHSDRQGNRWLQIESDRVESVPGWNTLQQTSRELIGTSSYPFMFQLLTHPPLNLSPTEAELLVPSLRYFWADIAQGDSVFDFSHFPLKVRRFFDRFSAVDDAGHLQLIDNTISLRLS
jgi:3',5'-cyclic AMP phosphodiesterase CpdA